MRYCPPFFPALLTDTVDRRAASWLDIEAVDVIPRLSSTAQFDKTEQRLPNFSRPRTESMTAVVALAGEVLESYHNAT